MDPLFVLTTAFGARVARSVSIDIVALIITDFWCCVVVFRRLGALMRYVGHSTVHSHLRRTGIASRLI